MPANDDAASKTERDVFDLHVSGTGGRGRGVVIEDTALAWQCAEQPRRRALDDITTVRIWVDLISGDLPTADCDITFADGERLRLMMVAYTWKNMKYAEFREFVLRFFERLDPAQRARIIFCAGPSAPIRMWWIIISAGCLAMVLGVMVSGVFSGWVGQEDGWLFMSFLLIFAVATAVLLALSIKSGPRTFDPTAVPARVLPPVPDDAGRTTHRSTASKPPDRGQGLHV